MVRKKGGSNIWRSEEKLHFQWAIQVTEASVLNLSPQRGAPGKSRCGTGSVRGVPGTDLLIDHISNDQAAPYQLLFPPLLLLEFVGNVFLNLCPATT